MELDDVAVAQFLRADPQFFERNLNLLEEIALPDPHGGAAVSMTERQQAALREKMRLLEGKLLDLLAFGETNDAIGERMHRLTCAILETTSFASLITTVVNNLRDDFQVPHVAVRLWASAKNGDDAHLVQFATMPADFKDWANALNTPYCGHHPEMSVADWFGSAPAENGAPLQSFALIPLRDGHTLGLLALASPDPQRFYPDMGTLFLQRISDMLSAALSRYVV
jgi:uncharacterized protein YigA (DUF484 family)